MDIINTRVRSKFNEVLSAGVFYFAIFMLLSFKYSCENDLVLHFNVFFWLHAVSMTVFNSGYATNM